MIRCYAGTTADELWLNVARSLLDAQPQAGRGGATKELLHVGLTLGDPRARWVTVRRPALNPAFALVEAVWILSGSREAAVPNFWNPVLPRFAGDGSTFHGAYGWRLRHHFGIDQVERAVTALRKNPDSRQIVLQIWDSAIDFPDATGRPVAADIPCNTASHLKVRDGRLHWLQIMRSNDVYLGTPHNIVQFSILQEVIAARLGIELGNYDVVIDSLHVYERDIQRVCDSLGGQSIDNGAALPQFGISEPKWESARRRLVQLVEAARTLTTPSDLANELRTASDLPADWPSAIAVIYADAARRHQLLELADRALEMCTNGYLLELYQRWQTRVTSQALTR
jgi:thymidylate synthase